MLIPEEKAVEGLQNIRLILANHPTIKYVFPMSLQVNYWLQKLGFYTPNKRFIEDSEPNAAGLMSTPPYYQPKKQRTFLMICGNQYKVIDGEQIVIPVLHVKNFPLKRNFIAYSECYDRVRSFFKSD